MKIRPVVLAVSMGSHWSEKLFWITWHLVTSHTEFEVFWHITLILLQTLKEHYQLVIDNFVAQIASFAVSIEQFWAMYIVENEIVKQYSLFAITLFAHTNSF